MKKLVKLFDKTGNELVPDNIKNTKSTSTTDTYCCNYVNRFGKLLWSGSFSEGSINVEGSTDYTVFIVEVSGLVCCIGNRSYGGAVVGTYNSYAQEKWSYRIGGSGDNWTIDTANKGGSNGTSNMTITAIYGLF